MKWQFEISDCPENHTYPVVAHSIGDNGVKRGPVYLSIDSLVKALEKEPENFLDADALRKKEKSTPPLPFGTICYSSNDSRSIERITIEIPKRIWDIRYGTEDEIFSIGFPRMVVQYLLSNTSIEKMVKEMRIYAVLDNNQPIQDNTALYTFPFPNVGKTNGIVCWGQNKRLELKDITELERAFRWFVAAPFNEDHGVRTTFGISNFRKLIDTIKEQSFDDDWLIPMNKTFEGLFG